MTAPDQRLDEIEDRLSAASKGPWEWGGPVTRQYLTKGDGAFVLRCSALMHPEAPDAEFIAAAPADVAYLLAELRKAHEALARVEALADKWEAGYGPGTRKAEVFGPQKVSIEFAVKSIRAAVAAADGDGQ